MIEDSLAGHTEAIIRINKDILTLESKLKSDDGKKVENNPI